jgi:hypothetical protein
VFTSNIVHSLVNKRRIHESAGYNKVEDTTGHSNSTLLLSSGKVFGMLCTIFYLKWR